jgi:toxin HigB-1
MAMRPFSDKKVEMFFVSGRAGKKVAWAGICEIVRRKLDILHYAALLSDLNSPPGNRLEALKGAWNGFHSIRINDQWRVVFRWSREGAENVRVIDYH